MGTPDVADGSGGSPTVLRMMLGAQLRRLRESRGLSREEAGYTIRASGSKMSRLELGRVSFKDRDVADLLILYGVTDADARDQLVSLAKRANEPGWWHHFSEVLPPWFQAYVGLEESATIIRTYEAHLVPGLLQTEDYARAVVSSGRPADQVESAVALRMQRQQLLSRPQHPRLWAIVDEAALQRHVGGPGVMRAQLEHLIAAAKRPEITIQVLALRPGVHAAEGHPFVILRFAAEELPDVVYVEQLSGALYLDRRDDVRYYAEVMDRLAVQAHPPEHTPEILTQILESSYFDF